MNICRISGPLGKDPDIVQFQESGSYEATLTVATHRTKNRQRITDWHTVVVKISDLVETEIRLNARKGMVVEIEGELIYENFTNSANVNIRLPKIIVRDKAKFLLLPPVINTPTQPAAE